MNKETITEKMIKHFYGIKGPLDEYKRQQADRLGNAAFIWLFYCLIIGNCAAIILANYFPSLVAHGYPVLLEIVVLVLAAILSHQVRSRKLTSYDENDLSEKEKKSLQHVGLKAGLLFGICMYLINGLFSHGDKTPLEYWTSPISIIAWSIAGVLFGGTMALLNKLNQDQRED